MFNAFQILRRAYDIVIDFENNFFSFISIKRPKRIKLYALYSVKVLERLGG